MQRRLPFSKKNLKKGWATSNPQMVFNLYDLIMPTPKDSSLPFSSKEIDAIILIKPLALITLIGFFSRLVVNQ
jgi:hypothetical protein